MYTASPDGQEQREAGEHDRHHHRHHRLLLRVGAGGRHLHLHEHHAAHQQRRDVERVLGGEVVDVGEERRAVQLDRVVQRRVERDPDRHLDQARQAAAERRHAVRLVEVHRLDRLALPVVLVLLADGRHLRRQLLHLLGRHQRLLRRSRRSASLMNSVSRTIARPQLWAKPWKNFSSDRIGRDRNAKRDVDGLVEADVRHDRRCRHGGHGRRRLHRLEVVGDLRAREDARTGRLTSPCGCTAALGERQRHHARRRCPSRAPRTCASRGALRDGTAASRKNFSSVADPARCSRPPCRLDRVLRRASRSTCARSCRRL